MKVVIALVFVGLFVWSSEAKPVADELVEVEGDMLLTKNQLETYHQINSGRSRRAALKDRYLWPKGIVYYTFSSNLDQKGIDLAKKAMKHWMDKTCIKFVKRTNQKYYATFQYAGSCKAQVSYARKAGQLVSVGSKTNPCKFGSAVHELGHTLGFFHEQVRPDRNKYITVKEENMIQTPASTSQLIKDQYKIADKKWIDYRGEKYDYGSIMHYSRWQGSKGYGKPVMVPKKPNVEFGQRDGLSDGDVKQTKLMYKCNAQGDSELDYNEDEDTDTDTDKTDETDGPKPGEVEY